MIRLLSLVVRFILLSSPAHGNRTLPFFVSTQWLSDHLNDPDIVILHVGFNSSEYKLSHIPNARFLWFTSLAPSTPDYSTEMPALEQAKTVLENLGITHSSKIVVVFSGQNVTITARMMLALSYFGFGDQSALLDGGFELWKSEGRPVTQTRPEVQKTTLSLTVDSTQITDADWVKDYLLSKSVTIVDSRTKNFYDGNGGGIVRQGHIAGAVNVTYASVLDSANKILPADKLQLLFEHAGVKKGSTVVTYCHVGQQASLVYYAARSLGYKAKVYDGSFEDWNVRDESYPVEKKPVDPPKSESAVVDTAKTGSTFFTCPPCGCSGDNKKHPKAGNCPDCGMAMIEKK